MAASLAAGSVEVIFSLGNLWLVALPSIQRQLHESSGDLEWVVSAYALSLAALIPLSGTLGDRFGRKRFFAGGMVVFALEDVLAGDSVELDQPN